MGFIEWSEAQFSFFKNPIRVANISNVKKIQINQKTLEQRTQAKLA